MLKYRMPTLGEGTRIAPLQPKYPVGPRETRGIPWEYNIEGFIYVFVDGTDPPDFASNPDVELIETLPDIEQPLLSPRQPIPQ
jgi:hypothetical protein